MGLFTSLATGIMLLYNGIMIGVFDTYFAQHGLLAESLLGTMLHGTLELSAIVVAGAAGLAMGNGWLFPGTYSRLQSFRRGALRGLKIVVGTVPVFVVAGFIESFITRHTDMAVAVKLTIIGLSAAFVRSLLWFGLVLHRREARRRLKTLFCIPIYKTVWPNDLFHCTVSLVQRQFHDTFDFMSQT
jgi:hypothetical protein